MGRSALGPRGCRGYWAPFEVGAQEFGGQETVQCVGGCSPDLLLRLVGPRRGQGTSPGRGGYRTRAPRSWARRRPRAQGLPWSGRPRALAHAAGLDRGLAGTGGGPKRLCQPCESGAWTRGAGLPATAPARLRRRRGLARSWPRGGINPRGRGARLGDYGAPPRRIYSRGDGGGGREEWRRREARRAAGVPGGPAPSPSSTSSPAYPRAAPRPGSPARRRPPPARAPRSRGSLRRPRPCPAPAAAAAAPARRPAGPRSRPPAWVSGRGARERRDPGRRRGCGARPPARASPSPRPAGARLPWPLRLGPAAPLPLAAPTGGSGAPPGAGGPGPQRRTRRHRTIFSEEQLQALEALFVQNQYPDVGTRERLAGRIRLREERVEVGACSLGRVGLAWRAEAHRPRESRGAGWVPGSGAWGWRGRKGAGWSRGRARFLFLSFNPLPPAQDK